MVSINENDFIKEAIFCIKESDFIKAQALLQYFTQLSAPFQNRVLYEISMAPDAMAHKLFEFISSLTIEDEEVREKLFEVILDKAYRSHEFIINLLKSGTTENKLVVLKVIKTIRLKEAIPDLLEILSGETNIALLRETIRIMAKIGDDSCIPVIADFIFYDDQELKSAAVYTLAEIRTPRALEALKEISNTPKVDKLISDTVEASIDLLESYLYQNEKEKSPKPEPAAAKVQDAHVSPELPEKTPEPAIVPKQAIYERFMDDLGSPEFQERYSAVEGLMCLDSLNMDAFLELLESSPVDIQANILRVLRFIDGEDAADAVKRLLYRNPTDDNLKFALYDTIATLPDFKAAISLIDGIEDPCEVVRMAAARAINDTLSDVQVAGIRSKIETGGKKPMKIVAAIIDSHAKRLFESLIGSDTFTHLATEHLSKDAHHETRSKFISFLEDRGNLAIARNIQAGGRSTREQKPGKQVFILHPSETLKYYLRKILYKTGCTVSLFSKPQDAVSALRHTLPHVLLCDPYIEGIDGKTFAEIYCGLFKSNPPGIIFLPDHHCPELSGEPGACVVPVSSVNTGIATEIRKHVQKTRDNQKSSLSMDSLNSLSSSPWVSLRPPASELMVTAGPKAISILRDNLRSQNDEVVSLSLEMMGKTGNEDLSEDISGVILSSENSMVRGTGYEALIKLGVCDTGITIKHMIREKTFCTRLSAARYLDRCISDSMIDEIKALTETGDTMARGIVAAIIDSYAVNIFNRMIKFDTFAHLATYHLSQNVHLTTRDFYLDLLKSQGFGAVVRSILSEVRVVPESEEHFVFIVSEQHYRLSVLSGLLQFPGMTIITVDNWDQALEMLTITAPSLIITDLYGEHGSNLAHLREVRKRLREHAPPVGIITNVSEFCGHDNLDASKRVLPDHKNCFGITSVFVSPIEPGRIRSFVKDHIKKV